jgi:ADP-ribosylglycohydrolase
MHRFPGNLLSSLPDSFAGSFPGMEVVMEGKSTLRDCVYGQAVGDALGVPYEFNPRGTFVCADMAGYGTHHKPAGTWSDDTSMTLATCDSIRELGRIDSVDIRHRFERWYYDGAYTVDGLFDVGGCTAHAIRSGRGQTGEYDNGNGSLMRILPLAFTDATDNDVRTVSAITHAHRVSCDCCVDMVHIARRLIDGEAPLDVAENLSGVPENEISSSGFVCDTYRAALWCLVNTSSYAECVLTAVNLGDDTDTTAAVAGGLAGIVYGSVSIPSNWMDTLLGKDIIEACLF